MLFSKKLTFVEHKEIVKNDKTYHKLVFKDESGSYIDSLVDFDFSKLVAEKDYICDFEIYKQKKTYELKMKLMKVR